MSRAIGVGSGDGGDKDETEPFSDKDETDSFSDVGVESGLGGGEAWR